MENEIFSVFTSCSKSSHLFADNALICSSSSATNTCCFILLTESDNLKVVFVSGHNEIPSSFSVTQFHLIWLYCLCHVGQAHAAFSLPMSYYFIAFTITLLIIQNVYKTRMNLYGFLLHKVFQLTLRINSILRDFLFSIYFCEIQEFSGHIKALGNCMM